VGILSNVVYLFNAIAATQMGEVLKGHILSSIHNQMRDKGLFSDTRELNTVITAINLRAELASNIAGYVMGRESKNKLLEFVKLFKKYNIWETMIANYLNSNSKDL